MYRPTCTDLRVQTYVYRPTCTDLHVQTYMYGPACTYHNVQTHRYLQIHVYKYIWTNVHVQTCMYRPDCIIYLRRGHSSNGMYMYQIMIHPTVFTCSYNKQFTVYLSHTGQRLDYVHNLEINNNQHLCTVHINKSEISCLQYTVHVH